MSYQGEPTRPTRTRRPLRPVEIWLGALFFGLSNFVLVFVLIFGEDIALPLSVMRVVYPLVVLGFAAFFYAVVGWRGFAVGLVAGFVLMTAASGGACTLFTEDPAVGSEEAALAIYPLALLIGGIGVAVHALIRRARRR